MKYTIIPRTAFQSLQLNAGILLADFDPATGEASQDSIIGATTGGVNFTATPTYSDFGEDIDNCPTNMMQFKRLDSIEAVMSGTFVSADTDTAALLIGSLVRTEEGGVTKLTPSNDLVLADFHDVWWIGDYSDVNTGDEAGYMAIHLINALNTGGFQIQSNDNGKGNFAFTFTGHYSMDDQDKVPYEVYIKSSSAGTAPEGGDAVTQD